MTQAELLRYLVETLEALGVEYMIGGSHAAMYYGEPRLTRDVDVVVTLHPDRLPALLQRFPRVSSMSTRRALAKPLPRRASSTSSIRARV